MRRPNHHSAHRQRSTPLPSHGAGTSTYALTAPASSGYIASHAVPGRSRQPPWRPPHTRDARCETWQRHPGHVAGVRRRWLAQELPGPMMASASSAPPWARMRRYSRGKNRRRIRPSALGFGRWIATASISTWRPRCTGNDIRPALSAMRVAWPLSVMRAPGSTWFFLVAGRKDDLPVRDLHSGCPAAPQDQPGQSGGLDLRHGPRAPPRWQLSTCRQVELGADQPVAPLIGDAGDRCPHPGPAATSGVRASGHRQRAACCVKVSMLPARSACRGVRALAAPATQPSAP